MRRSIPVLLLAVVGSAVAALPASGALVVSNSTLGLVQEGGTFAAGNAAAGATPFALDELGGPHLIVNLNDILYGNSESWLGGGNAGTEGPFAGISFGSTARTVSSIAFGRDNGGEAQVYTDRSLGLYTLQYTQVANPQANLGLTTTGNPTTGWVTIGTLDYQSAGGPNFAAPALRHRYDFNSVSATGVRLIVPATGAPSGTAIDEIELYSSTLSQPIVTSVIQDETVYAKTLPNLGTAIPAEPAPGDGNYHWASPGTDVYWTPLLTGKSVRVEVSWGVSFNHSQDVDYFVDPDGAGPLAEIALAQNVNQALLNDQVTSSPTVVWSGFFEIGQDIELFPGAVFRIRGNSVGVDPYAVTSAVWRFSVPEPSAGLLGLLGFAGLAAVIRRRRNRG
jgi:MYXO-CTERM domain-containing protein